MSIFDNMKRDLSELVKLVRESERYCTSIAARPDLASDDTHAKEIGREHRIAELSQLYGIST